MKGRSSVNPTSKTASAPARRLALALSLIGLLGCTKADPPQFRLNLDGLDPTEFIGSSRSSEDLATRVAGVEEQIAKLQAEDPDSGRIKPLEEDLTELQNEQSTNARAKGLRDTKIALRALFGTPDEPYLLSELQTKPDEPELGFDMAKLSRAAGPVGSLEDGTQIGLYRQHCVHCHGITGDGVGPTAAFLTPYPRDFRRGVFKFTSTSESAKPTKQDLKRTLQQGIAGTAMPSFALLPEADVDALVEYVKYLSLRGEMEADLMELVKSGDEVPLNHDELLERLKSSDGSGSGYADLWDAAAAEMVTPEAPPELDEAGFLASIEEGRKLFLDAKAQCVQCHGPTGLGDGTERRFDVWNEAKTDANIAFFTLPKQQLMPRNLRLGVYRGGRRPVDLYRRIQAGIKGAQMPSMGQTPAKPAGLTPTEIWSLVHYVQSLPYESISETGAPQPSVQRDLN